MYRTRGWPVPASVRDVDAVAHDALPRFLELFAEEGVRATFFVIGEDAAMPETRALLERAAREGHEIANHSMRHLHLPTLPAAEMEREVVDADALLAPIAGRPIAGFRSPAWMPTEALLDLLVARGYRYDASVFPSPWLSLWRGRAGLRRIPPRLERGPDWRYVRGPRDPWRVRPRLVEIPAATIPIVRLPIWGTILHWLGPDAFDPMLRACAVGAPVSLVLHGWELVDFDWIGDARFLEKPGIARPPLARVEVLRRLLRWMKSRWRLMTLEALAAETPE